MKKNLWKNFSLLALAAVVVMLFCGACFAATDSPTGGILNTLQNKFHETAQGWEDSLKGYALSLFYILFTIGFVWGAAQLALQGELGFNAWAGFMVKEIMFFGFWMWVIDLGPKFINIIVQSFATAATKVAAGGEDISASTLVDMGIRMYRAGIDAAGQTGWAEMALMAICMIPVIVIYALMAGTYLVCYIESYIIVYGGVILLGFAGIYLTRDAAIGYIRTGLGIGTKLLVMILMVGMMMEFCKKWEGNLTALAFEKPQYTWVEDPSSSIGGHAVIKPKPDDLPTLPPNMTIWDVVAEVLACSVVMFLLQGQVGSLAQSMVSGGGGLGAGGGQLMGTAGRMMATAAGVYVAGRAAVSGAAGGARGMLDALQGRAGAEQNAVMPGGSGFDSPAAGGHAAATTGGGGGGNATGGGEAGGTPPPRSSGGGPVPSFSMGRFAAQVGAGVVGGLAGGMYGGVKESLAQAAGRSWYMSRGREYGNEAYSVSNKVAQFGSKVAGAGTGGRPGAEETLKNAAATQETRGFDGAEGFAPGKTDNLTTDDIGSATSELRKATQEGDENRSALNANGETLEGRKQEGSA